MIKRLLAVCVASLAVIGSSAGAALAEYPPSSGSASVSATTVVVGTSVQFAGSGFKAGSKVTVSVNDAVYATLVAGASSASALGHSTTHFTTAALVRTAAVAPGAPAGPGQAFSVRVTMNRLGMNTLTGSGVDPAGNPRLVTAKVTVTPVAATGTPKASGLPFTGSSVVVPGIIIGLTMMAGGLLLLTTVRSRRVGSARS